MKKTLRRLFVALASARAVLAAFVLVLAASAQGAWYWPFDPDSTNKPPRLHRLLVKANDYIERAEDESLDGNGDKAIENYRLALAELDRVEKENPDRADTPEFAPLRTKRATCQSAIDTIRFAQVNENERAVSVTDTRELQKKWNKKHGIQTPEEEEEERQKKAEEAEKKKRGAPVDAAFRAALEKILGCLRTNDFAGAQKQLDALEAAHADDLSVLQLRAAAEVGLHREFAARRTLEKAVRLYKDAYQPLYNLAQLVLQIDDDKETAKRYYERGRKLGGPANAALEKLLK